MSYITDLLFKYLKGRNSLYTFIFIIAISCLNYIIPRTYSTVECNDGSCTVLRGQKQVEAFASEDIESCAVAPLKRRCHYGLRLSRKYKCYYPRVVLKNGENVYLPDEIESSNKHIMQNFCSKLTSGENFSYKKNKREKVI